MNGSTSPHTNRTGLRSRVGWHRESTIEYRGCDGRSDLGYNRSKARHTESFRYSIFSSLEQVCTCGIAYLLQRQAL